MQYKYVLIVFVTLSLFSCKKEDFPEEGKGNPVFFVDGMLGSSDLIIKAGKDDYYMETYYRKDQQNILEFVGELVQLNSPIESGTLRFLIRNNEVSPGGVTSIESSLAPSGYSFRTPTVIDNVHKVQFTTRLYGDSLGATYLWNFGDGTTSTEKNPEHTYADGSILKYHVSLDVNFPGISCSSSLQSDIFMPTSPCSASISYNELGIQDIIFEALPDGRPPYKFNWEFNTTGHEAVSKTVHYDYVDTLTGGVENTCLKVIDANNCEAYVCSNIVVQPSATSCAVNFDYTVETENQVDSTDLSKIIIEYVDFQGNLYTSNHINQPKTSMFNIKSQQGYNDDRNGNKTRQIEFNSECWLYSAQDSVRLVIDNGTIAVAYP